ncbi:MAG: hypothetical protein WKF94_14560 [Solirubrobacteraceae bacterium]
MVEELEVDSAERRRLAEAGRIMFAPGIFVGGEAFSDGRPISRSRLGKTWGKRYRCGAVSSGLERCHRSLKTTRRDPPETAQKS